MCQSAPCAKPDCTYGDLHRRECEARLVMSWPRQQRADYYQDVKKKRGEKAALQLAADVKIQWERKQ